MQLVYIHGASATSESFNYIRSKLGTGIYINYDSRNGFENNLTDMLATLQNAKDIFFIAHSLGGIYSLHIANAIPKQVMGAVTLSTPYGGAEVADVAKYFLPFSRLQAEYLYYMSAAWTMIIVINLSLILLVMVIAHKEVLVKKPIRRTRTVAI